MWCSRSHGSPGGGPLHRIVPQVAVVDLLQAAGCVPTAVVAHSTGEIAAAYAAGMIDKPALVTIAAARMEAVAGMRPGAMAAWNQGSQEAEATLASVGLLGSVVVACQNSDTSVTLSGDRAAVEAAVAHGKANGIRCTKLRVQRAFHSSHVDPALGHFRRKVSQVSSRASKIPFFSSTEGRLLQSLPDADFWCRNMRQPVLFYDACMAMRQQHPRPSAVVELSFQPILKQYLQGTLCSPIGADQAPALACAGEDADVLRVLARAFCQGATVNWAALCPPGPGSAGAASLQELKLPKYPWQNTASMGVPVWRQSMAVSMLREADGGNSIPAATPAAVLPPSPRQAQKPAEPAAPVSPAAATSTMFGPGGVVQLGKDENLYLEQHKVTGDAVMPGAGMMACVRRALAGHVSNLEGVTFNRFMPLWPSGKDLLKCRVELLPGDRVALCHDSSNAVEFMTAKVRQSFLCPVYLRSVNHSSHHSMIDCTLEQR